MSAESVRKMDKANDAYASAHSPSPSFKDFPDQKAVLVLTCLDPRCEPHHFWDLPADMGPGIMRNAGGRVTEDVLRSIRVISTIMSYGRNTVGAVVIVHHTDCGMINFSDDFVKGKLKERHPGHDQEIDEMFIGEIKDLEKSLKEDVALIRADPFLPKDLEVLAFEYDVFTGKAREVKV
ncbi:hypothetical protein B0A48_11399 [Cryoendolithus antarcticus]|uniref:Carbonic anhydrase n=1 Tax=Cryoendolithus antarcticus TaxID=1507870 RepID=A0A1V8SVR7_9PEZI|nr:hypothetical protein B0A48_11399 [Cryoendolithus antarcticus]